MNQIVLPYMHFLLYGVAHAGKSTFARTLPVPHLVFMFDYWGKDIPYLEMGDVEDLTAMPEGQTLQTFVPIKRVWSREAQPRLLLQLEYYHELDPQYPTAYKRFRSRMVTLRNEWQYWESITLDSVTTAQMMALKYQENLNPDFNNQMLYYAKAKSDMEETLMIQFGSIPKNVCVIAHEQEKEITKSEKVTNARGKTEIAAVSTGKVHYGINAIGQLSKLLPCGFSELYRMVRVGDRVNLQTSPNGHWPASTSIHAPNPCEPEYAKLWVHYKG